MPKKRSPFKRFLLFPLVRGLTGFPLALAALLAAIVGLARFPAAGQRRIAQRLGNVAPPAQPRETKARPVLFSVVTFLPSFLAFFVVGICLMMVFTGYMYPIRPGVVEYIHEPFNTPQEGLNGAWGGNTINSAWIGHSVIAFPLHIIGLALCIGYSRVQDALVRKFL